MKISLCALIGAVAAALSANLASAQSGIPGQPVTSSSYYAQDEPSPPSHSDMPAAPSGGCTAAAEGGCQSSCDSCGSCDHCDGLFDPCCTVGEPWKLFDGDCAKCRGLNIGGVAIVSYAWNPDNPGDKFNGPVTWTDRSNEFDFNRFTFYVEKATDTKGCGTDLGYRIDFLYGTDNRFVTAADLETRNYFTSPKWSTYRFYGLAMPQAYAEVAYDDWKIKVGHFFAPCGYEGVDSSANFFANLPYTFQYGEPFTHTGILATNKVSDEVSFSAGVVNGWDSLTENPNVGFITVYSRTREDKSVVTIYQSYSNEPTAAAGFRQRFLNTFAYSKPLNDCVTVVLQSDFGYQNDATATLHDAEWYGLNSYIFRKISDCTTLGLRAEWFRDEEGTRVGGFLGNTPSGSTRGLDNARFGYPGNFYEVTAGATYKVNANATARPYVRWDWFDETGTVTAPRPFDTGSKDHQFLLGFDYVVTY